MSSENSDRLTQIVGRAGGDPRVIDGSKGEFTALSVAVTLSYGEEDDTRWVNVTVNDPGHQKFVNEEISKGTRVVAVGFLKTDREYKGVKQYDLRATEIGFATMAKKGGSSSKSKPKEKNVESEELGW